jgi:glycosyltransferase involved in cell wall biosynthesis
LSEPHVLVLQLGARLHYAVPAVYARANALHRLYTDACASVGFLSVARRQIPRRWRNRALRRLLGRTLPPEVPPELVRVETFSTLTEWARRRYTSTHGWLSTTNDRLRRRILQDRFAGANCFYAIDNGDLELLKAARDQGLAVIYEQISCPTAGRFMREERSRFPGVEPQDSEEKVEQGIATDLQVYQLANAVICASEYVREQVQWLGGREVRAALAPYGIHQEWLEIPTSPVPGRILCVGTVGLLKGHHYLAEATRRLRARGVRCEVRVVGPHHAGIASHPLFQGPTYVGQVPREMVRSEFAQADVFVLPTLSDGFGISILEALACGVPAITTPNCGGQVRDGRDGFVVPIRDAVALADRLEQLLSDRKLRAEMSLSARARARELSWARFGERLLAATGEAMRDAGLRTRGAGEALRT